MMKNIKNYLASALLIALYTCSGIPGYAATPLITCSGTNRALQSNGATQQYLCATTTPGITSIASPDGSIIVGSSMGATTLQINYSNPGIWSVEQEFLNGLSTDNIFGVGDNATWANYDETGDVQLGDLNGLYGGTTMGLQQGAGFIFNNIGAGSITFVPDANFDGTTIIMNGGTSSFPFQPNDAQISIAGSSTGISIAAEGSINTSSFFTAGQGAYTNAQDFGTNNFFSGTFAAGTDGNIMGLGTTDTPNPKGAAFALSTDPSGSHIQMFTIIPTVFGISDDKMILNGVTGGSGATQGNFVGIGGANEPMYTVDVESAGVSSPNSGSALGSLGTGTAFIRHQLYDNANSAGTFGYSAVSNGSGWNWTNTATLGPIKVASITGINAKTIANTVLYTVPTGKTFVATSATVRSTASSGTVSVGPIGGVGNVAGTNNIFASQSTGITATNASYGYVFSGTSLVTVAGATIYYNLGTGATGTGTETISIDLMGYLN